MREHPVAPRIGLLDGAMTGAVTAELEFRHFLQGGAGIAPDDYGLGLPRVAGKYLR
jgi:hypothetical protein